MSIRKLILIGLVAAALALASTPSASAAVDLLGCQIGLNGAVCPL